MKKIIVLVIGVLISSCSNDNLIDENSEMLGNLNKVELNSGFSSTSTFNNT